MTPHPSRRISPSPPDPSANAAWDLSTTAAPPAIPTVTLLDALRPLAWIPGPYSLDFGDRLARTLVVIRFPAEAWTGFLSPFFRLPYPRRMSWHIQPLPSDWALQQLGRRIDQLEATARSNALHGQSGDAYITPALEAALDLRQRLARQETRMYGVSFAITLLTEGSDAEALKAARKQEAAFLQESTMWVFRNAAMEQDAGFWSTTPVGRPPLSVPQELDAETVALMFPFVGGDIIEPRGVMLGTHPQTHAPILLQWYDRTRYPAANMVVAAKTRSGKSTVIRYLLIQHLLRPGTEALVLDPSKPVDYQNISQLLGTFVRLRPGSRYTINPLEIRYPEHFADLEPEDQQLLDRKLEFVVPLLGLMLHPETRGQWEDPYERSYAEQVCKALYTRFGITNDPTSLLHPDTMTWTHPEYRTMPTLADVRDAFAAQDDPTGLGPKWATILTPWVEGSLSVFNGPTTVDLDQRLITLNIESLTSGRKDLQAVVHYVVAEILAQRMLSSAHRKMIVLDEAHILFQNPDTAQWAARLYRMAAKSNAQIVLITQGLRDLIGDPEHGMVVPGAEQAQTCLINSYLKLLMHQDTDTELSLIQREFQLSPDEREWLRQADTGVGLLVTHRYHVPVVVVVPDEILSVIHSNPGAVVEPGVDPLAGRRPQPPGRGTAGAEREAASGANALGT